MLEAAIRALGLAFLLWTSLMSVPVAEAAREPSDRREVWIQEPIFNGRIFVQEAGLSHSKTVVLVHGLGAGASRDWKDVFPELSRDFHVLAFDLPGFGRSDAGNHLYSPARYAALMAFLVPRFSKGPVGLVGHSMGGAVAMSFAASHPENVSRLVLASVPGILHRQVYSRFLAQSGAQLLPEILPQQDAFLNRVAETVLRRVAGKPIPDALILLSPLAREKFLQADPARIAAFATAVEDFSPLLTKITAPTLVLWGTQDPIAPTRTATLLASQIPNARLEWMEGAGHVLMKERPHGFTRSIMGFFNTPGKAVTQTADQQDAGFSIVSSGITGKCREQSGTVFEGSYDAIEIVNCRSVLLRNVRTPSVSIVGSGVTIENSQIGPHETALTVRESEIVVTGGRIEGDTAVLAEKSSLDLAGVTLVGSEAAVKVKTSRDLKAEPSVLEPFFFSVCPIRSPHHSGYLHGARVVHPDRPL